MSLGRDYMKVLYSVSTINDWVDVAKYFYDNYRWTPILWQTTKENQNYVKLKFPNIDTIDFFEANRGNFDDIKLEYKKVLSKNVLNRYLRYEKITIKMMDRMDPTRYSFNYSERVQLYYGILEFILNYIDIQKPDLLVFHETPHFPFEYLLYAVAIENNIEILRFSPTHINGKTFLSSTLTSQPKNYDLNYKNIMKNNSLNKEVDLYINKINSIYTDAIPFYMREINSSAKNNFIYKILYLFLKSVKYLYKEKLSTKYFKSRNKSIHKEFSKMDYAISILPSGLYKIKLQNEYQKYVKLTSAEFNLNDKFIYFPLHYQPEKTTSPEGDFFADQFLAINMLSKFSKGRFNIYVKEHISQFSQKLKGEQGRQIDFYMELYKLGNIIFVDMNVNSFLLIDKSIAVATITGTAGIESVIRGTPTLIFGYPWYKNCHSIFFIENENVLQNILNIILSGYKVDSQAVKYFLYTIFSISEEIYFDLSELRYHSNGEYGNQKSIIQLVETNYLKLK